MRTIALSDFLADIPFFVDEARKGKIFVYPTDTIYGIGGIVTSTNTTTINIAKQRRAQKHYSIIAPDIQWIKKYFRNTEDIEVQRKQRQDKFPTRGLTLLLKANKKYQKQASLLSSNDLIGIRLIQHPFQDFVAQLQEPFITTSANISGQKNITKVSDIDMSIKPYIDYAVDGGILDNISSVVINGKTGEILRG